MTTELGRAERHALEIDALAREIVANIADTVVMLRDYKRGYPTGGNGRTDPEAGPCTRTEALALAGPDAVDRDERDLRHALDRALRELHVAYNITQRYRQAKISRDGKRRGAPSTPAPSDEGWCASCIRDGGYLEPAAVGRYADRCRFCGEWKAEHGGDPPMEIVKAKHEGRRITNAMADRALAAGGGRR